MLRALLASTVLVCAGEAALAQSQAPTPPAGCEIETQSYVTIDPPTRRRSQGITTMPQTPCAVIPNGYEGMLGQISIDINPNDPLQSQQQGEDGAQGPGPTLPPRRPDRPIRVR